MAPNTRAGQAVKNGMIKQATDGSNANSMDSKDA
jgi:hypothetical protein